MLKILNINTDKLIPQIDKIVKNPEKTLIINDGFCYTNINTISLNEITDFFKNSIIIDNIMQEQVIRNLIHSKKDNFKIITENDAASISSFISEIMKETIAVENLKGSIRSSNFPFEEKLLEILEIYNDFLNYLKNNHFFNKEKVFTAKINNEFKNYDSIVLLPLNDYNSILLFFIVNLLNNKKEVTLIFDNFSFKEKSLISKQSTIFKNKIIDFVQNKTEFSVKIIPPSIFDDNIPVGFKLLKNAFLSPIENQPKEMKNINFHCALSPRDEIENVLSEIKRLNKKYKYSDIAIVGNSIDTYIPVIKDVFKNIPIFINYNEPFSKSYLYKFILMVLTYCKNNSSLETLKELIRFPWFDISSDDQDVFDLFFLRFGDNFEAALKNGEDFAPNEYEIVREILTHIENTIKPLKTNLSYCSVVKDFLVTINNFFENINITKYLKEMCYDMSTINAYKISLQWQTFCKIFENLNSIFPNKKIKLSDFIDILSNVSLNTNVSYNINDASFITISDINDFEYINKKVLFFIGNNENTDETLIFSSIINSYERKLINVSCNTNFKTDEYYMDLYYYKIQNILTFPRDILFISWAKTSIYGKELYPASYINNISKLFDENTRNDAITEDKEAKLVNLLTNISNERYSGITDPLFSDDFVELCNDEYYAKRIYNAIRFLFKDNNKINAKSPEKIYKDTEYFSATRLENFNKCPFRHFIDYGILPQKLNVFGEEAVDRGDYFHSVFNLFFSYIINNNIDLKTFSEDDITKILLPIFEEVEKNHNDGTLSSSFKNLHEKEQLRKRVTISVVNNVKQLKNSNFVPEKTEFNISKDNSCSFNLTLSSGKEVFITGIIDRYDVCDDNVRIIDYKSSGKSFNLQELEKGIQLQLPLYSSAINKKYNIVGMYYFHIYNPILDVDKKEDNMFKKFQLSGPTLATETALTISDNNLLTEDKSDIIPVSRTKAGKFTSYSQVYSKEELEEILKKSQQIAQETIEKIISGETAADPIRNIAVSPCTYCEYNKICRKK